MIVIERWPHNMQLGHKKTKMNENAVAALEGSGQSWHQIKRGLPTDNTMTRCEQPAKPTNVTFPCFMCRGVKVREVEAVPQLSGPCEQPLEVAQSRLESNKRNQRKQGIAKYG